MAVMSFFKVRNELQTTAGQSHRRIEMTESCCCSTDVGKHDTQMRSKFTFTIMKEIYEKKGFRALFSGTFYIRTFK